MKKDKLMCDLCGKERAVLILVTYNDDLKNICLNCMDKIETATSCMCCKCGAKTKPDFIRENKGSYKIYCTLCGYKE